MMARCKKCKGTRLCEVWVEHKEAEVTKWGEVNGKLVAFEWGPKVTTDTGDTQGYWCYRCKNVIQLKDIEPYVMETRYIIRKIAHGGEPNKPVYFWNGESGWDVRKYATKYTEEQAQNLQLPMSFGDRVDWLRVEE